MKSSRTNTTSTNHRKQTRSFGFGFLYVGNIVMRYFRNNDKSTLRLQAGHMARPAPGCKFLLAGAPRTRLQVSACWRAPHPSASSGCIMYRFLGGFLETCTGHGHENGKYLKIKKIMRCDEKTILPNFVEKTRSVSPQTHCGDPAVQSDP